MGVGVNKRFHTGVMIEHNMEELGRIIHSIKQAD